MTYLDPLIYLDHNATTPVDPLVVEAMQPFFTQYFGNPSSLNYSLGWQAEAAVENAREQLAIAINADPSEVVFTSGATEANNLAIKGVAESYMANGKHIITVETEHSAVLEPCRYLERLGFSVTYLPVQPDGLINISALEQSIRPETILVSIMAANNEIGVLHPIAEIGKLCHEKGVIFHTDAAQALGKIPLDVQSMDIDLLSMTAHKLYGPKGSGALYVRRRGRSRVQLSPQMHGGGQERGLRSGTLCTPQIVGFGVAVKNAIACQSQEMNRQRELRDRLWQSLQSLSAIHLNGHPTQRLPNNLSISIEGVRGADLLAKLRHRVALSSGSACSTQKTSSSHVIKALGRSDRLADATLRFGLGQRTTAAEIEQAAAAVIEAVQSLRVGDTK